MISRKCIKCDEEFVDILFLSLDKKDYCIVRTQWKTVESEVYIGTILQSNIKQFKGENIQFQVCGEGCYSFTIDKQDIEIYFLEA